MSQITPILMVVILGLVLFAGLGYNRFVRLRNLVANSWSNIETELKRRYDLIPNVVETVRHYASHERAVLELVTNARSLAIATNGRPADVQAPAEQELVKDLRILLATAEAYPDLKASRNFLELQQELALTEDRIQLARRIYNANVLALNTRVEVFPTNLLARMFGFTQASYFEVEEAARPAPTVDL
ncbi:MAG: LemA family protein [Acidimicrobiia bacterium]